MVEPNSLISGNCKRFKRPVSYYHVDGEIENRSCMIRCTVESDHLNASKTKKIQYDEYSLPDGVPCGNSNSFHYCVKGKCEVSMFG